MTPATSGPRRRSLRRAMRGTPTGRRATHQAETTYGHRQRERDRRTAWLMADARAEMEADMAARELAGAA